MASVTIPAVGEFVDFEEVLTDELNVKKVIIGGELAIDTELTPELVREGLSREIIRYVQAARKNAGLNVDDRISLSFSADGALAEAIDAYKETIAAETLATSLSNDETYEHQETVTIDGDSLSLSLQKA